MRYSEISRLPSTPEEAENAMLDLVAVYRSNDASSIPMQEIISMLHNQGFDADARWVMSALQGQAGVDRITKDGVMLHTDTPPDDATEQGLEQSQAKVSRMAAKAARKSIDNGK
jgi:hypothetical protein